MSHVNRWLFKMFQEKKIYNGSKSKSVTSSAARAKIIIQKITFIIQIVFYLFGSEKLVTVNQTMWKNIEYTFV